MRNEVKLMELWESHPQGRFAQNLTAAPQKARPFLSAQLDRFDAKKSHACRN